MIRVNLLQVKRKKKAKPLPAFVVLGVILAFTICIVAGAVHWNQLNKIKGLEKKKRDGITRLNQLKAKVKEVDDYEAKIEQFKQQKKVIEDLREQQSLPVKVLNEMSAILADGVWLTDMKVKGNEVTVKGNAFSNSNVVEFVNNLKGSKMFSDIYLLESKSKKVEEVDLFQFHVKFVIKAKEEPEDGKKA